MSARPKRPLPTSGAAPSRPSPREDLAGRDERALAEPPITLRGVLLLADDYDRPGGLAAQARGLARGLGHRGVPTTVVTLAPPGEEGLRAALRGALVPEVLGLVQLVRVPCPPQAAPALRAALLEAAALVVARARVGRLNALLGLGGAAGDAACRVGRALGVPALVKLTRAELPRIGAAREGRVDRRAARARWGSASALLVADPALADQAAAAGLSRVELLPDLVDAGRFTPRPWDHERARRVAYLGALAPEKGLHVLLDAFTRLGPAGAGVTLDLLGRGDEAARRALAARAGALGLVDRVRLLAPSDDPLELLRDARAFVLPASRLEASNALWEALATGCPAVAPRVAGIATLLRDGEEALLVPPGDAEALAAALRRLLGDPDLAARLREAGRAAALRHDEERVTAQLAQRLAALGVPRDAGPRPDPAPPVFPLALAGSRVGVRLLGAALRGLRRR